MASKSNQRRRRWKQKTTLGGNTQECRSVRVQMRGANQRDQQPRHSIGVTTIQSVASVVAEEEEGPGRE